ncbi:RNA-directed DNA polymerase [Bacillus freudenreichii]|nr:RNA-directed DNA polymerase [Bacillus freudenreichii]
MEKDDWYVEKFIKRKNKLRKIVTYNNSDIRNRHTIINNFLNGNLLFSKFSKAYIKGKSIYDNAYAHLYNDYFISLDIEKYFNNIDHNILIETLYYELNKTSEKKMVMNKIECTKLVNLCSTSKKGLPLGLITSPTLSNIYLKEFDNILYGKLKRLGLESIIYTRYADDITISFKYSEEDLNIVQNNIYDIVSSLLKRYKLKLNYSKSRFIDLGKSNHVRITGISIVKDENNYRKLSVGRKSKKELFYRAIDCYRTFLEDPSNVDYLEVLKIKGMESFFLSIEKRGYENFYSKGMQKELKELGFDNLNDLIRSLPHE